VSNYCSVEGGSLFASNTTKTQKHLKINQKKLKKQQQQQQQQQRVGVGVGVGGLRGEIWAWPKQQKKSEQASYLNEQTWACNESRIDSSSCDARMWVFLLVNGFALSFTIV